MKKVLILGAGVYQVPLILKAKAMGLFAVVASAAGDYPGFPLADRAYRVDTTDREGILHVAREECVAAVCTAGTDVAVPAIAHACRQLGLKGLSEQAAARSSDKAVMKEAFRRNGVATADFQVVRSLEEARRAFGKLRKPVMLKVVDRSGSRGITRLDGEDELDEAYRASSAVTRAGHMVLEEYIRGKEIGVDAFVQNGRVKALLPHDKIMYAAGKTTVPYGHIFPVTCGAEAHRRIVREAEKVIEALGFDDCAVNMDLILTDDGKPFILEAAGRAGATGIPELISHHLGCDFYKAIIDCALGIDTEPDTGLRRPCASLLIGSPRPGVFRGLESLRSSRVSLSMDCPPGTAVPAFMNGTHRIGQAVLAEDSCEALLELLDQFRKSLVLKIDS